MSFVNPSLSFKKQQLSESLYLGTVIDNVDPLKIGRLRVRVVEVHGSSADNDASLPWATPLRSPQLGAAADLSSFHVPDIGTRVLIMFHRGSIYSPLYSFIPLSLTEKWSEMDTNYPERYGFIDSLGNKTVIDKTDKTLDAIMYDGATERVHLRIDPTKYQITDNNTNTIKVDLSAGTVSAVLGNGYSISISSSGAFTINAPVASSVTTPTLTLNGNFVVNGTITASSNIASTGGDVSDQTSSMQDMRNTYNSHTHNETGSVTNSPNQSM